MRISDWSSDVCSSDLLGLARKRAGLAHQILGLARDARRVEIGAPREITRLAGEIGGLPDVVIEVRVAGLHIVPVRGRERLLEIEHRAGTCLGIALRSEEHTSELQSLMRISSAVFCLKQK